MIKAYPLQWPVGWRRSAAGHRTRAKFSKKETKYWASGNSYQQSTDLSVNDATRRTLMQLEMMRVHRDDIVISSNLELRLDGLPRSGQKAPADPGVAVYWRDKRNAPHRCMAIDRYDSVEGNLAAIAATLEAMRAIERHGGAEILDRAFTGFKALEAENAGPGWWDVLGVDAMASAGEIERAFKLKARSAHPDAPGGSHDAMTRLNAAREQGLSVARGRG